MTAIVGLINDGKVYMGADSCSVDGYGVVMPRKDPKLYRNGSYLIGFTHSYRMGQLLAYCEDLPTPGLFNFDGGLHKFFCTVFVEHVRKLLRRGGHSTIKDNLEEGGNFMVGYKDMIVVVNPDYQVAIPDGDYFAIGSGAELALGSLYSTNLVVKSPKERIRHALGAAARFNHDVREPFLILEA